jgi:hypothetical protein
MEEINQIDNNTCAVAMRRPWWQRLLRRLSPFDNDYMPWPWPEDENSVSGKGISIETYLVFGLKDRLRLALGGIVQQRMIVTTENEPGATEPHVSVRIRSFREKAFIPRPPKV